MTDKDHQRYANLAARLQALEGLCAPAPADDEPDAVRRFKETHERRRRQWARRGQAGAQLPGSGLL
jgi:hypothetical protein